MKSGKTGMGANKVIGISIMGVCLALVIWVAVAAAGIGSEASSLDSMLKSATEKHEPIDSVMKKVKDLGFDIKPSPSPTDPQSVGIVGKGPDHWAVIYRTWLTLNVDGGPDLTTHGYHIDRAGSIF